MDAIEAANEFCGMGLEQAFAAFRERPEARQEDFMFMGPRAFLYYLPVLDRYLREVQSNCPLEDCEAKILGKVLSSQWDDPLVQACEKGAREMRDLASFVLLANSRYSGCRKERMKIRLVWEELANKLG